MAKAIRLLALFLFTLSFIYAEENGPNIGPEPVCLVNLTSVPSTIVNDSVNIITGDFVTGNTDYPISGPDSYSIGRSYSSSSHHRSRIGLGWSFHHAVKLQVFQPDGINFTKDFSELLMLHELEDDLAESPEEDPEELQEPIDDTIDPELTAFEDSLLDDEYEELLSKGEKPCTSKNKFTHITLQQPGGGSLVFKGDGWAHHFEPRVKKTGWTNVGGGAISGQTNIKNIWAHCDKKNDRWLVRDGDGTIRIYTRKNRQHHNKLLPGSYNFHFRDYLLREERRPSGNRLIYHYNSANHLCSVKTTNRTKTKTISWVKFHEKGKKSWKKNPSIPIETSDGKQLVFNHEPLENGKYGLKSVENPGIAKERIVYSKKNRVVKTTQNGHFLHNLYYGIDHVTPPAKKSFSHGKVGAQKAPAGVAGKTITTHRYHYYDGNRPHTTVLDAHGNKTRYFYMHKRPVKVEKCASHGAPLFSEEYNWGDDEDEGNLVARTIFNEHGDPILSRVYHYDSRHNVVKEEIYGSFTGKGDKLKLDSNGRPKEGEKITLRSTYSGSAFNVKTSETDPDGNKTYYYYKPRTNLLVAKFICDGETIRQREFYKYDDAGIVVEKIVDNGTNKNRQSLSGVTQRFITRTTPREAHPHYGEPEVIKEYAYDFRTGQEIRLRKTVNTFNKEGLVINKKTYDQNGQLEGESRYKYDKFHRLISTTDPLGNTIRCAYDELGRLVKKVGPRRDAQQILAYDVMGRLVKTTEIRPDGTFTNTFRYDELGRKIASIDPQGNETRYKYDALGRVIKITLPSLVDESGQPIRRVQRYAYDNMGLIITATDEKGHVTVQKLNAQGKPLEERFPDGTCQEYVYDLRGNVVKHIAPNGLVTKNEYDYKGRLTKRTEKNGDFTSTRIFVYDAFNLLEEISPTGEKIRFRYDFAGRKSCAIAISADRQSRRITTYHYDASGRLAQERSYADNNFFSKNLEYDVLNRVISETTTDRSGALYSSRIQSYDAEGNVTSFTLSINGQNSTTTTTYLAKGVPVKVVDALGNTTTTTVDYFYPLTTGQRVVKQTTVDPRGIRTETVMTTHGKPALVQRFDSFGKKISEQRLYYDACGNNTKIIELAISGEDEKAITTLLCYGPISRLESITQAAGTTEEKVTKFFFNKLGQQYSILHANGVYIRTDYDEKGRVSRHYSENGSFDYSYSYDASDRILTASNNTTGKATLRSYNGFGELSKEVLENDLAFDYTYDKRGRLSSLTLPDRSSVAYEYTPAHLQKVIRKDSQGADSYSYEILERDLSGIIRSARLPNNTIVSCERDLLARITKLDHELLSQSVESYDPVGNILTLRTRDPLREDVESFSYDALSQLTQEPSHSYSYDSLYNRLSKDGTSYSVNSLHSLLKAGDTSYSYDRAGNRTTKTENGVTTSYRYDELDRLIGVTVDGIETIYAYDAFNRRISKSTNSETTHYLYVLDNEIGSATSDGTLQELRVLGEGLGAEIGAAIAMELHGTAYVPLHDYRGNTVALTDFENNLIEWYRFSAFGEEELFDGQNESTSFAINPWRFSGKRYDSETQLINFGRRYYDPSIGKWLTQDPLGLKAGPNLYAYVMNAPLTHFDLYGLEAEACAPRERSFAGRCYDMVSNGIRAARDFASSIIENAFNHLIPGFSKLKESLVNGARQMRNASPTKLDRLETRPVLLKSGIVNVVTLMRGIVSTLEEAETVADGLYALFAKFGISSDEVVVIVTHNPTQGLVGDLLECALAKVGFKPLSSINLANTINEFQKQGLQQGRQLNFLHIAHSEGALLTYNALDDINEVALKNMTILTFGAAKIITNEHGRLAYVKNYVAATDGVTHFLAMGGLLKGVGRGEVEIVGPYLSIPFTTHFLDTPHYQAALYKGVDEFIKRTKK